MQSITTVDTLHEAIVALESRRREQEQELTSHFMLIYDALKPVNVIKNTFGALAESTGGNAVIGLVSGFLFRKLFLRSQSGILKKILGTAVQFGITILVRKKGDAIKAGGFRLLRSIVVNHNHNGSR